MNRVTGYLELDGNVFKITSIDDLKDFVNRFGSEFKELNDCDFAEQCSFREQGGETYSDDCGVIYSKDGKKLLFMSLDSEEYKIKEGTAIIGNEAIRWNIYFDGYKYVWNTKREIHVKLISMPDSIIAIGSNSFLNNKWLTTVNTSQNIKYIGKRAFSGCASLSKFDWPSALRYIGANAFEGCEGFTEVLLNDGIKKIGSHAFKNCVNLGVISLPSTIEAFGSGVFEGCNKLKEIRIPKGSTEKFSQFLPFSTEKFVEMEKEYPQAL